MGKNHLKRISAPKRWSIERKAKSFTARPNAGAHSLERAMPICTLLKQTGHIKTTREAKYAVNSGLIYVDGRKINDYRYCTGLMDVVSIPKNKEHFRVVFGDSGKLALLKISESDASLKPCRIEGKSFFNGKLQINLSGGRNILVDKEKSGEIKTGDTIFMTLPEQKVSEIIKLEKGSIVYFIEGKLSGRSVAAEEVKDKKIIFREGGKLMEGKKGYALAIGKNKPIVKLDNKYI